MLLIVGAALAALASAEPPPPPKLSTPTAAEVKIALDSPAASRYRLDSMYDPSKPPPYVPFDPLAGLGMDLQIRNRQFQKFTLTMPSNLRLEVGNLAVVPRNSLITTSPYFNVRKDYSTYGGPLDGSLKLQAGAVYLGGRLFYDDNPALDARVDQAITDAGTVAPYFGLTPERLGALQQKWSGGSTFGPPPKLELSDWARKQLYVDTSMQYQWIPVMSALGQLGRTLKLWGPFDLGLVAGGLARYEGYFPNLVLDQSAALRTHVGSYSAAIIGGVSEGLGLQYADFWSKTINNQAGELKLHPEFAPHAGAELWGALPFWPDSRWDVGAGWTFNPLTTRTEIHATTIIPTKVADVSVGGRYDWERGPAIEFDRKRAGGEVSVRPFGLPFSFYGGAASESIQFGDAGLNNNMVLFGIRGGDLTPGSSKTLAVEEQWGGTDVIHVAPQDKLRVLQQAHHYADLAAAFWKLHEGQIDAGWDQLRSLWGRLDPDLKSIVQNFVNQKAPGLPSFDEIFATDLKKIPSDTIRRLAETLTDGDVYERILVRFMRHQVLAQLDKVEIPVLGNIKFNAPVVFAAAHAYSLGFTPLVPMTERDARGALDPFLLQELQKYAGGSCQGFTDAAAFTNCLIGKLPPAAAAAVQKEFGPAAATSLRDAIAWHSNLIRHQVNETLLSWMVTAEALDELPVDQGVKIGDIDRQWLVSNFDRKDFAKDARLSAAVRSAKLDLTAELKAEVDDLKSKLASYGSSQAAELQAMAEAKGVRFEVAAEDWPRLLAFYKDKLIPFMAKAIDRSPKGSTLRIGYHAMAGMGTMTMKEANGITIKLPPLQEGRSPDSTLDSALEFLPHPVTAVVSPYAPLVQPSF